MLQNKAQEFKQLTDDLGYPTTREGWEETVLRFCMNVDLCFQDLSKIKIEDSEVQKCMISLQRMAKGKGSMNDVQKIQLLAYNIAQDFKSIYETET